jgi:hypothetical protein
LNAQRAAMRGWHLVLAAGAALLPLPSRCFAAWPSSPAANLPICTTPVSQDEAKVVPDGSGGVIVAWHALTASGTEKVFAQHVDRNGTALWGPGGIGVCAVSASQQSPVMTPDSSGGAVVVWQDDRSGEGWDIYAQRIDHLGNLRWSNDGVSVSSAPGMQVAPVVASDGHGGVIIGWQDFRAEPEPDLYAQALDNSGQPQWSTDGIAIQAGPGAQSLRDVVALAPGGGVFVTSDSRAGEDNALVVAQRVDVDGSLMWGPRGVIVDDAAAADVHPVAVGSGDGSVIIAWESGPIFLQRLDNQGRLTWGDDGIPASTEEGLAPAVVQDREDGVIIAWQTATLSDAHIRAQSVRASGVLRWSPGGIVVCGASGAQTEVAAIEAGRGGAIFVWRDVRDDPFGDLYAQRIDSSGVTLWPGNGTVVSSAPGVQESLAITGDGFGGAVAVWSDGRAGRHIYAQRIGPTGHLGGTPGSVDPPSGGHAPPDSTRMGTRPRGK